MRDPILYEFCLRPKYVKRLYYTSFNNPIDDFDTIRSTQIKWMSELTDPQHIPFIHLDIVCFWIWPIITIVRVGLLYGQTHHTNRIKTQTLHVSKNTDLTPVIKTKMMTRFTRWNHLMYKKETEFWLLYMGNLPLHPNISSIFKL